MVKQITIEISDSQEKFLKEFASKHYDGAKDNLITRDAFHVVQTKKYSYIPYSDDISDYYDPDNLVFSIDEEYYEWFSSEVELIKSYYQEWRNEDCPIEIKSYDEVSYEYLTDINGDKELITSYDEYFKAYGINIKHIAWREEYWDDVAFFFILDEAKRYIEYQRHNLHKPRTYTYSAGYSNYGDFVPFRNLLLDIGTHLNKEN